MWTGTCRVGLHRGNVEWVITGEHVEWVTTGEHVEWVITGEHVEWVTTGEGSYNLEFWPTNFKTEEFWE